MALLVTVVVCATGIQVYESEGGIGSNDGLNKMDEPLAGYKMSSASLVLWAFGQNSLLPS
jgi:hypothetical protein